MPDYTSPPLSIALDVTPDAYRSDDVIDSIRAAAAAGKCTATENRCHIPFPAPESDFDGDAKVGVVFYGGGLVDPRGYSVIADLLATRYGLPTVVPVFVGDIAFSFGVCDTGRLDLAKAEFPNVEKWVLAGHSFGGIAAMADMWERRMTNTAGDNDADDSAAGLVMLAADVQDVGCGAPDYSKVDIPMAAVTGSVDAIVNTTRWEINKVLLSNATQLIEVYGGNHGQFGAYDDSGRLDALEQVDGQALVTPEVQWDLIVASIASVAARTGVAMPVRNAATNTNSGGGTSANTSTDGVRCMDIGDTDSDSAGESSAANTRSAFVAWSLAATSLVVVTMMM